MALPNQEMSDAIPVSSTTDWSAAFGFDQKEVPQDDDLGIAFECLPYFISICQTQNTY